jgi:hypothetical protein
LPERRRKMKTQIQEFVRDRITPFFKGKFALISEINSKYAEPKIKMTRSVKIALLGLRLYLVFLVILLAYKFYTMVKG